MIATVTPSVAGSLDHFPHRDETTHIGTVFYDDKVQLSQWLNAKNGDELLKDLATLVSHRGVVFFKKQDLNIEQQKELATRIGQLSGKPETSTLHKHPVTPETAELGSEVSVIDSHEGLAKVGRLNKVRASGGWHADITFENVPSDYSILKMHTLPPVGGDTLWASGYEAYDKLSPTYAKFLEGLTAIHSGEFFIKVAEDSGIPIQDPRGSPQNTGTHLTAVHPVVRTNPVTGFKSLFVNQSFATRIVELTPDESDDVLAYLARHISENHDFQVRYRWEKNDIAIWDNRSAFHTATHDYFDQKRQGDRVVSIGERPFFDPKSHSRRVALGL